MMSNLEYGHFNYQPGQLPMPPVYEYEGQPTDERIRRLVQSGELSIAGQYFGDEAVARFVESDEELGISKEIRQEYADWLREPQ